MCISAKINTVSLITKRMIKAVVLLLCSLAIACAGTTNPHVDFNVTSSTCGGNCPGGCGSCPCGSSTNYQSVSSWCSKYSGWKQSSCECIMNHESGGNANAVNQNGNGGSYDVGLWQVNDMNWSSCSGGKAPCDPSTNLNCGKCDSC